MKRNRKAKILATLGPASSSRETIERVFEAGCDVFRLNFSHGSTRVQLITRKMNLIEKVSSFYLCFFLIIIKNA